MDEGTSLDAAFIAAPRGKPLENNKDQTSKDKAATHTKKHGQLRHGYKAHVASGKSAMTKNYRLDTAKVHDINHLESLTEHEGEKVYADSAYRDTERRKKLEDRGVFYPACAWSVRDAPCVAVVQRSKASALPGFKKDRNGLRLVGNGLQPLVEPQSQSSVSN